MKKRSTFFVLVLVTNFITCQSDIWFNNLISSGHTDIYDFTAKTISGNNTKMDKYKGYVLIFVNIPPLHCQVVSSFLKELTRLEVKYYMQKLRVLGFQSKEFGCDKIDDPLPSKTFIRAPYYSFDVFQPVQINGYFGDPLWSYLRWNTGKAFYASEIESNYVKFIVNSTGNVVERVDSDVTAKELEGKFSKYIYPN